MSAALDLLKTCGASLFLAVFLLLLLSGAKITELLFRVSFLLLYYLLEGISLFNLCVDLFLLELL